MSKIIFYLLIILFVLPLTVLAQDNTYNPAPESPQDNECFAGGTMEGKCSSTDIDGNGLIEDWEMNWHWECGWYLARFNNGVFSRSDIPRRCRSLLPPPQPGDEDFPPYLAYISLYSLSAGQPCNASLQIYLSSPKPLDLIIYAWNASYGKTHGDPYPTVLHPGTQLFTVTFGGEGNPDYFYHTVHIRNTKGQAVSNYISGECTP